ncbi:MAG: hypothetical protein Q8P40_16245 [Nitrospirota bacterium]|nr:hypothetical protein [Nitrospirota bacterium]
MKIAIICPSKDMTCGIGDYSRSLAEAMKDKAEVIYANDINEKVLEFKPEVLNLQWEYGLYDGASITTLLNIIRRKGIHTSVTLHGWSDYDSKNKIIENLFDSYVVLNQGFKQHLVKRGIKKPIHVIPMGVHEYEFNKNDSVLVRDLLGLGEKELVVGAFGFLELYKNYHTIIDALVQFSGITFLLCSYSKDPNSGYAVELQQRASRLGVKYKHLSSYMSMDTVAKVLHACDALVYPYVDVFTYSSSAAIRTGISSLAPVIASDITFFNDVPDVSEGGPVYKARNGLVEAITKVLTDESIKKSLVENAQVFTKENNWNKIADLYIRAIASDITFFEDVPDISSSE